MDTDGKTQRIEALYEEIRNDPLYRSEAMGTRFVPGRGFLSDHPIVFIGEAPGREEEEARAPFVGAAGKNFDGLLSEVGISRDRIFITNLVKYRPRTPAGGNRAPSSKESRYALDYLLRELEILSPSLVVCLGLSAAKALLNDSTLKMREVNGRTFSGRGLTMLVTYHPSPFNFMIAEKRKSLQAAFRQLRQFLT